MPGRIFPNREFTWERYWPDHTLHKTWIPMSHHGHVDFKRPNGSLPKGEMYLIAWKSGACVRSLTFTQVPGRHYRQMEESKRKTVLHARAQKGRYRGPKGTSCWSTNGSEFSMFCNLLTPGDDRDQVGDWFCCPPEEGRFHHEPAIMWSNLYFRKMKRQLIGISVAGKHLRHRQYSTGPDLPQTPVYLTPFYCRIFQVFTEKYCPFAQLLRVYHFSENGPLHTIVVTHWPSVDSEEKEKKERTGSRTTKSVRSPESEAGDARIIPENWADEKRGSLHIPAHLDHTSGRLHGSSSLKTMVFKGQNHVAWNGELQTISPSLQRRPPSIHW